MSNRGLALTKVHSSLSLLTLPLYNASVKAGKTEVINKVVDYITKAKEAMEADDKDEAEECTPQEYQEYVVLFLMIIGLLT